MMSASVGNMKKKRPFFPSISHALCLNPGWSSDKKKSKRERERKRELPNTKQMLSAPGLLATRSIGSSAAAKAGEKEENGDEKT